MAMQSWRRGLGGAVAIALSLWLAALPAEEKQKPAALPSDLAKIPSDGVFVVSGRIADLWGGFKANEKDLAEASRMFEKGSGVPLEQAERITLAILAAPPRVEPLIFLRTLKPYDRAKVLSAGKFVKQEKYQGQTLFLSEKYGASPIDDRSLVFGPPDLLRAWIDHPTPKGEGALTDALRLAAGKHALVCGLNVKAIHDSVGDKLPDEAKPFLPLLEAHSGTLTVDLGEQSRAKLSLRFANEKDAQAAAKPAQTGLDLARVGLDQGIAMLGKQTDTAEILAALKQARASLKSATIEQQGKMLQASSDLKFEIGTVKVALLKAVKMTREAANRMKGQNNLRQLGLAVLNYESTYAHYPARATYDKNGKPMLSWRVTILPFIEQQALYMQFHLDEPWDSEHNKKLLAKMPEVYASPFDEKTLRDHTTYYQGFSGKDAFFDGKNGTRIAFITDGTSNTIALVEASKAVPWTKPEDIPYDASKPLPKLGLRESKGFNAVFCDGSVRFIRNTIKAMTLRNLITRSDGNIINFNDF